MYGHVLYRRSPVWAQELLIGGRSLARGLLREGRGLRAELADVLRTERLDADQLEALQIARLKETLLRAGAEVPHYRALFARIGFEPRDFTALPQLQALPVLEKAEVQAAGSRMLSEARLGPRFASSSSGTTGSHLVGWRDRRAILREQAFIWRQLIWAGVQPGERRAWIRGDKIVPATQQHAPFWRHDRADRLLVCSSYHLTPVRAGLYVEALQRFDPVAIHAYPSALLFIATVLDAGGRRYAARRLRALLTSSETLLPAQRSLIERVFGCPVFDWYGSFERVNAIGTCEHGQLHLLSDYGHTELLDGDGGQEMLGTGFDNRLMPLIRYRIKDRVQMATEPGACACGRAFPRVRQVLGRGQDMLHGLAGHRVLMPANVFDELPGLLAGQWRQRQPGRAELLLQFAAGRALPTAQIEQVARRYVGPQFLIDIRLVERIERTAAGKLPAVVHLHEP